MLLPRTAAECGAILKDLTAQRRTVNIAGNGSKRLMAGPVRGDSETLSTARMNRLLQYEPADLTVSVEAAMRWSELQRTLAQQRQRIALDPPFAPDATVGGIVASNSSGPLRRGYGTARDLVIGMTCITADGRLIQSGGMVVKNVAGLDLAKLMIGSFGTLAVIGSVNFRVHSRPERSRTFLLQFNTVEDCLAQRDGILQSVLQPECLDVYSPVAAARLGLRGYVLAIRAGGSRAVLDRYARELAASNVIDEAAESEFWQRVREFTPEFLRRQPAGLVVRASTTLAGMRGVLKATSDAIVSRGASGVSYIYLNSAQGFAALARAAVENGWKLAVEFAPDEFRKEEKLWLGDNTNAIELMSRIKQMFDPANILNPGRMYGRF